MMEQPLSSYRIFYMVAKTGNISRAAKELYISQPAISKAILKLESSLNVTLFLRSSRGVTLTEEGKLLFEHVDSAFNSIQLAEEQITKMQQLEMGQIRIGVSTTLCKYLLLPYLKDFIEQYPHIKVMIECRSTFHTLKLLEENKIDIGLIGRPVNERDLSFHPICSIQDTFVTTTAYLNNLMLRDNECTLLNVLHHANVMLLDEKNITRRFIEDYFRDNNIIANQVLEISNMDLLIEFAKIGLGVACVIREFVEEDLKNGTLIEIPLDVPIQKRDVGFSYNLHAGMTPAMKRFLNQ